MDNGAKGLGMTFPDSQRLPVEGGGSPKAQGELAPSSGGFAGRLDGTTIADLVQFECASGRTRAIRVQSRGRTGYLCFEQGRLVHAIAPGALGDKAVLQILGWQDGAFEPARVRWPSTPTVHASWQHLLLTAAHTADEKARGKVVEFPPERSRSTADASIIEEGEMTPRTGEETIDGSSVHGSQKPPMQENSLDLGLNEPLPLHRLVTQAVRLDAAGRVTASRGNVEEFSGVVAYSKRLGDLIGEALGAGKLRTLKYVDKETQIVVYEEESGSVVGISMAASANLTALDQKLGL